MACNCIKNFDYNISYKTCKEIHYQDASTWVEAPESYNITIQPPVGSAVTIPVTTLGVTIITSVTLGLTSEPENLPAGIYCVTITNCNGDTIQKDFINLCTFECQLANLIAAIDLIGCNEDAVSKDLKFYYFIKTLIDGAKAKFDCDWCSVKELKQLIAYIKKKLDNNNCTCK
jgi:hypothetical protein